MLERALEGQGYRSRTARDGAAALREVRRTPPDLILLDLLLPRKDGRSVLGMLQESKETREIPVIVISGVFRNRAQRQQLLAAGARAFIEKPFSLKTLMGPIHEILGLPSKKPAAPAVSTAAERTDLSQKPAAEVLWEAARAGFSGAVHLEWDKRCKQVIFEAGEPRLIRSNVTSECIGRRLLDAGRIDERALKESLRRSQHLERRLGEILVEMGALPAKQLEQALAAQAEEKLLDLFGWTAGQAWRQEGVREGLLATELTGWTARRMILAGVQRMKKSVVTARLAPHSEEPVVREEIELAADERTPPLEALLRAIEPRTRVGDLVESHGRPLYGAWLVGAVRIGDKPEAGSTEASDLLVSLEQQRARQAEQSHFEVLGVPEDVGTEEVRRAFVALAKQYHPDRFKARGEAAQRLAAEIFARISVAHDTLSNPESRRSYREALRRGGGKVQSNEQVARILNAEREFRSGQERLRKRDYAGALACFERALELDSEEGEFHALAGWTHFLVHREEEEERRAALQRLQRSLTLAPKSPTGYYYTGLLLKACGDTARAEKMFKKAVSVAPEHVEATRELRLIERRKREGAAAGSTGLFGRGRKK